ncbi:MAG: hypothetical protein QOD92_1966 [Acidimicrobiaceae bacterium]|jgi:hypothetical protein
MRRVLVLTLVAVASLSLSVSAHAKTDDFELTVTHEATASPHAVVMTITTADATLIGPDTINVFLRSDLDDQLRPFPQRTGIQVHLDRVDERTSRAIVALASDGEWIVLPFADLTDPSISPLKLADRYPIVSFSIPWTGTIARLRPPPSSSSWPIAVAAVGGGAIVAGLLVLMVFRLLDRGAPEPDDSPPAPSSTTTG